MLVVIAIAELHKLLHKLEKLGLAQCEVTS